MTGRGLGGRCSVIRGRSQVKRAWRQVFLPVVLCLWRETAGRCGSAVQKISYSGIRDVGNLRWDAPLRWLGRFQKAN